MICPKCGKEAGEGKFCQECGTPVSNITTPSEDYPAQKKTGKVKKPIFKRWWFWLIVILFAFILLVALSPSDESGETTPSATVSEEEKSEEVKTEKTKKASETKAAEDKTEKKKTESDNKYVYEGKNFKITYEGVKTDNELLGMSGASSNLFGIMVTIQNLSDKPMTYTLRDIYVDDVYAGLSGGVNTSTPTTLAPGKTYRGHFSGVYGAPGDIKNASELEFKAVASDESFKTIEESPVIKVPIK